MFATPEYAKWTKTGGLGVMTDELSRGLATLGEDIYVITPIYDNKVIFISTMKSRFLRFLFLFVLDIAPGEARSY